MFWTPDISPEALPYKVLIKRGEFADSARDGRVVPYKIYYPADHGLARIPLIIWSHGFGGNRDGAAFLSRYMAAQGYVIAHLTHDGTDSSLWESQPGVHPWDILRKVKISRETTINRFLDVPFFLNALMEWMQDHPEVGPIDFENIGMSGHSFGAMTTQVISGQMFPDADGGLTQFTDDRFKAAITYSPVPIRHLVKEEPDADIYGPISLPVLHMTGTEDKSPLEGFGYEHRLSVYDHSAHPEKFALIKDGGDHMVYNGTRGKLNANPQRKTHEELIKIVSHAFWDGYLKDNKDAKRWLCSDKIKNYSGKNADFKYQC